MYVILCAVVVLVYIGLKFLRGPLRPIEPYTKQQAVFVTGCDSGFGNALAHKLSEHEILCFAGCFTPEGISQLKNCPFVLPIKVDVRDDQSVDDAQKEVHAAVTKRQIKLTGVVCNAGILGVPCEDEFLTTEDYLNVLQVNTLGVIRTCHAFKPMITGSRGRIVITTSMAGRFASPACGPYSVSKFGAEAYADVLRRELRQFGVSVHIVCPAAYKTQFTNTDNILPVIRKRFTAAASKAPETSNEEELLANEQRLIRVMSWCRGNLDEVTQCFMHALFSSWPQSRYHVGGLPAQVRRLLSVTPTFVGDAVAALFTPKHEQVSSG